MLLYNGEIGEPCGTPPFVGTTCPLILPDRERLLDQLQQTAVGDPPRDQRHQLAVRDNREVRLEINLHDTPGIGLYRSA